jgi:hypothetical protein
VHARAVKLEAQTSSATPPTQMNRTSLASLNPCRCIGVCSAVAFIQSQESRGGERGGGGGGVRDREGERDRGKAEGR